MEDQGLAHFSKSIQLQDGLTVNLEVKQRHQYAKKRKVKTWSPQEDQQLVELYEQHPKKWATIASLMTERNQNQCLHRFRRITQFGTHRKIWSAEEDETVKKYMKKVGKNWKILSQMLGTKTGKQIRERFINKLDPRIKKEQWSDEQDRKIIQLYCQIGRKWSLISKHLPGRPQNKIKNRFYSFIQKNYDIQCKAQEDENQKSDIRYQKQDKKQKQSERCESRPQLREITNQTQLKVESIGEISKQQKFFIFNFPSINQMQLQIKMDDFVSDRFNRRSGSQIGSMIKVQEEWMGMKQKDYQFCNTSQFQSHLFYCSGL